MYTPEEISKSWALNDLRNKQTEVLKSIMPGQKIYVDGIKTIRNVYIIFEEEPEKIYTIQ